MSALGHKQTCAAIGDVRFTPNSGLLQRTRPCPLWANSRLMQRSKTASLFDHLIRTGEQRRRHSQPKRLRGFQIDNELVLGRRLHRQVSRFLSLEDAIDVAGSAPKLIKIVGPYDSKP